jgi:hypothetical protein
MPGTRSIQAGETAEVHQFTPHTKFQPILHKSSIFSVLRIRSESESVGSICFWPPEFGSGSFYHQEKIVRKTLISIVLRLL